MPQLIKVSDAGAPDWEQRNWRVRGVLTHESGTGKLPFQCDLGHQIAGGATVSSHTLGSHIRNAAATAGLFP